MNHHNKTTVARKIGISRQALYYQPQQPHKDAALLKKIRKVMVEHPAYGHRRIALALGRNKKAIQRIMKLHGLKPTIRRKQPHKPDDQGNPATTIPNVLKRLCPITPHAVWAGDFTYLSYDDGFLYLATVIDVYTRELLGWHLSTHHHTDVIQLACIDAIQRHTTTPQIFHSDQGSEYTSTQFMQLLQHHHIQPSHANKASPWENGFQESFYSNFKLELGSIQHYEHIGQITEAIAKQIHYYNTNRIHTSLKMSPQQFNINYQLTLAN